MIRGSGAGLPGWQATIEADVAMLAVFTYLCCFTLQVDQCLHCAGVQPCNAAALRLASLLDPWQQRMRAWRLVAHAPGHAAMPAVALHIAFAPSPLVQLFFNQAQLKPDSAGKLKKAVPHLRCCCQCAALCVCVLWAM